MSERMYKIGDEVDVPWGVDRYLKATVIDVWDTPEAHVKVRIDVDEDPEEPVVLLLSSSTLSAA